MENINARKKDKGKYKNENKDKGKDKICPYFNDKGCYYSSDCKMLYEAPAIAARDDQMLPCVALKAKTAAAPKAAAADPFKH